jgi:enoyl-CoA hydratase/carnithine racemase
MRNNAVLLERDGHIATITLNRPKTHNAMIRPKTPMLFTCRKAHLATRN